MLVVNHTRINLPVYLSRHTLSIMEPNSSWVYTDERTPLSFEIRDNSTILRDNSTTFHEQTEAGEEECKFPLFILYVIIFGSMCLFGLVGNTLSIVVLQWEKHNHVATFMLQGLSLSDNLFLLTTGFTQIYASLTLFTDDNDNIATPYIQVYIWPIVHITQLGTIWMTVLIAANRYIAICRPFQAHKLCTMNKVRIQVVIITVFCLLYCMPRWLELEIAHEYNSYMNTTWPVAKETSMKQSTLYNIIYESALYCLFVFLGPLVILIILNVCLIRELWAARQRLVRQHMPLPGEEEEQNLTLVMIVIVLIFVICQTPAFLNQLLYYILADQYACGKPYFYYFHLSNLLVSANSSVNFVIYCVFRKQFRQRLYACCRRNRMPLKYSDTCSSYDGRTMSTYSRNGRCDSL